MTSSWYSVARCVSSTTTAAGTSSARVGSPKCAASRHSNGRNRLPPAVDQVPGGVRDEVVVGVHGDGERGFDRVESGAHRGLEFGVVERDAEERAVHPRSTAALPARSISHCGKTPSTTVTTTPKVSATVADQPGIAIVGAFSGGSAKNINTTMRR